MTLYAGIDGGQSSTVAVLGDEHRVIARGVGPPADLVGRPRDPAHQAHAIGAALAAARAAAGGAGDAPVRALVAGITGFDRGESPEPDLAAFARFTSVVHDTAIAHAGALGGLPGIVVIAGTGSVALGNAADDPATFVRAGGWGFFFGDEGGALWIARVALRGAMWRADRGEDGDVGARALAAFNAPSLRAIQHAFAHGEIGRPALAAFASDVLASADAGDPDAAAACASAAGELALLAATVDARLALSAAARAVSYAGGLFANAAFAARFAAALLRAVPHARPAVPVLDPAGGALVMARRLAREAPAA